MRKGQSPKKCTICGKPSITGLKKGHGKCQYHWNVGVFGKVWADKVEAERKDSVWK